MGNLLTNPYFSITLIIIIVIVLIMYIKKKSCSIEGMDTLKPLANKMSCKAKESYKPIKKSKKRAKKFIRREKFSDVDSSSDDIDTPYFDQYKKQKSTLPKPVDADPLFGNCLPCNCDEKKSKK